MKIKAFIYSSLMVIFCLGVSGCSSADTTTSNTSNHPTIQKTTQSSLAQLNFNGNQVITINDNHPTFSQT